MPLAFQDFWPRTVVNPAAGGAAAETLPVVVQRANLWLAQAGLRAVNVETLVLPGSRREAFDSTHGSMTQRWDEDHPWVQVVRVWYEVQPPVAPLA